MKNFLTYGFIGSLVFLCGCTIMDTVAELVQSGADVATGAAVTVGGVGASMEGVDPMVANLLTIGKIFIPALGAWEGVLCLLFKRKRQHYGNVVKAVLPLDGKVSIGEAVASLGKAMGGVHSSPDTKEVFADEVADAKADKAAKKANGGK